MGISGVCSKLIGDFLQAFGGGNKLAASSNINHAQRIVLDDDNAMISALITVFGMGENGRIKKEKARGVVEKLGLRLGGGDDDDEEEEEIAVEDVIGKMEEGSKRNELLFEAFKIFDVDGDGFIDTVELKRVLECLGLDKGWGIREIEKMVSVVDLNLDGKVDFSEFELMMGLKCP